MNACPRWLVWLLLLCTLNSYAYTVCEGIPDFLNLNASYVEAYTGDFYNPFIRQGVVQGRQTIISQAGVDYETGGKLSLLPPDETQVVRLGNSNTGAQAEAISYHFIVDEKYPVLNVKFAVVFQDPDHDPSEQPRFVIKITDENGEAIDDCAQYDVYATAGIDGFQDYNGIDAIVRWRDWTNVGLDLRPYVGRHVQIQFITYDCEQSGHFGYAYFTAQCIKNNIRLVSCARDEFTVAAPSGFASYTWDDGTQGRFCTKKKTSEDMNFWCDVVSVTGCQFRLDVDNFTDKIYEEYSDTICQGELYKKAGFNLQPMDVAPILDTLALVTSNGCDSFSCGSFVVLPSRIDTVDKRICNTESYKDDYFTIPEGYKCGKYHMVEEGRTSQYCYRHTLNIEVDSTYDLVLYDTICAGETLNKYNFNADSTGVYSQSLTTVSGCDSLVTLYLTVMPKYYTEYTDTICEGESYRFFGRNITETGTYLDSSLTAFGCDSVTMLHLKVGKRYHKTMVEKTTDCNPFYAFGNYYSESGVYEENLLSVYGCDSTTVLDLTVLIVCEEIVPDEYFTPDNDGVHDLWHILNIEDYPDARVRIFDRYGKLLYEKTTYMNEDGWNGECNGVPMPSSDYWYEINVPIQDRQYVGHFTLIRGN